MFGLSLSPEWARITREATKTILGGAAAGQMLAISSGGPEGLVGSWFILVMVILGYVFIEAMLGKPSKQ